LEAALFHIHAAASFSLSSEHIENADSSRS